MVDFLQILLYPIICNDDYIKITDQISNDDKRYFHNLPNRPKQQHYTLTKIGSYYENRVIINDILSKIGYEQKMAM